MHLIAVLPLGLAPCLVRVAALYKVHMEGLAMYFQELYWLISTAA